MTGQGRCPVILALAVAAGLCVVANRLAAAQPAPYWPSERKDRLATVEARIAGTMRELSTANYYGREDEAKALQKQLEALERESAELKEVPVRVEPNRP